MGGYTGSVKKSFKIITRKSPGGVSPGLLFGLLNIIKASLEFLQGRPKIFDFTLDKFEFNTIFLLREIQLNCHNPQGVYLYLCCLAFGDMCH